MTAPAASDAPGERLPPREPAEELPGLGDIDTGDMDTGDVDAVDAGRLSSAGTVAVVTEINTPVSQADPLRPLPILGGVEPVLDRRPPFGAVLEVLSREDPGGLLAIGAPISEYDLEADELARRLRAGQPISDEVLVEVWQRWFGTGSGYVRRTSKSQVSKLSADLDALR